MHVKYTLISLLVLVVCTLSSALLAGGADSDPTTIEIKVMIDSDGGGVIDDGETSETFSSHREYKRILAEAVARKEVEEEG